MADIVDSFWLYGQDTSMHRAHIYRDEKGARLQDGTHLDYVDENTFKNTVTGELLSRERKKDQK
jgi:hypothetical protein